MVDFFKVVGSIEDIDFLNLDHRSMFISVESTDLAHQNNMMGVTFNLFLVDKCISDDQDSLVISIQENLFVVGQVQDFILSLDQDVEFNEVVVAQAPETEYTSTAAICTFKVLFDKNLSCGSESLNSNWSGTQSYSFGYSPIWIESATQSTSFGNLVILLNYDNVPGGMPSEDVGKILKVEVSDYADRKIVFTSPAQTQTLISEDVCSTFPENVELKIRAWLENPNDPNTRYILDPSNKQYQETTMFFGHYIAMLASGTFQLPLGIDFNVNASLQGEYTVNLAAYAKVSSHLKHILYECDVMRAPEWNQTFVSVYSSSGYIDTLTSANSGNDDEKTLFFVNPQSTPTVYGCSDHTTQLVGRFYLKYREQAVDLNGDLAWGAYSENNNYYTITDANSTLPSC